MTMTTHVDLTKLFDKHAAEFAAAATMAEFIEAIPVTDAYKDFLRRYADADAWGLLSFRTHKAQGFVSKPLFFPEAKTFADLFETVQLLDYSMGGSPGNRDNGLMFVSSSYTSGVSYFGQVAGKLYIKVRRDDRFWCFGVNPKRSVCTYAKARRDVIKCLDNTMVTGSWYSIEIVKRDDGKLLVVGRDEIGSRWLALLPGTESMIQMLPSADQAAIAEWQAYDESVKALVTGETVDFDRAKELGVEIRRDLYA
jgi:hypothetical protein